MFRRKKIGYTLTELLVVVMIIAVLSAVVLPKFSKVLETRKTTEAEDLMTAVRQEQEYRCAADKPYASNASQLQSLANAKTKNFTLSFKEGGIEAAREGKKYKLSIPSYADGRICCEDINNSGQCAELNKEYPLCSNLTNTSITADYEAAPTNCLAEGLVEGEAPSGECENGATQEEACGPSCDRGTRVVRECVNGVWQNRNGECSVADHPCTCEYYTGQQKPADKTQTCNSCGTQTVSYSCNETTWQWVPSYGTCSVQDEDQCYSCCDRGLEGAEFVDCLIDEEGYSEDSPEVQCAGGAFDDCVQAIRGQGIDIWIGTGGGYYVDPYFKENGFKYWACYHYVGCSKEYKPQTERSSCNGCGERTAYYECDTSTGRWEPVVSECSKTKEECNVCDGEAEGTTKTSREETNCAFRDNTYTCKDGHWWITTSGDWVFKPGAECLGGQTKYIGDTRHFCNFESCHWEASHVGGGGGGNSGGGGGDPCHTIHDFYSGSWCTICTSQGGTTANCY